MVATSRNLPAAQFGVGAGVGGAGVGAGVGLDVGAGVGLDVGAGVGAGVGVFTQFVLSMLQFVTKSAGSGHVNSLCSAFTSYTSHCVVAVVYGEVFGTIPVN